MNKLSYDTAGDVLTHYWYTEEGEWVSDARPASVGCSSSVRGHLLFQNCNSEDVGARCVINLNH